MPSPDAGLGSVSGGYGALLCLAAKAGWTHACPASECASKTAGVKKAQFEGNTAQVQFSFLYKANGKLHSNLIQQLLVGSSGLAEFAAKVPRAHVERCCHQFFRYLPFGYQNPDALLDLFRKVEVGQVAEHVFQGGVQALAQEGIGIGQGRAQQAPVKAE